jgi:hypothetical protein
VVDSVVINQASPHTNDTLSVTVTSHDPNNDPVNYSYQWSKNNVDISGATGATLNMATNGNGGKGDASACAWWPMTASTTARRSPPSPITVLNTVPVASVSIDNTTPGSNDVITATATDSDLDGDTVTLTYVWRVNNVVAPDHVEQLVADRHVRPVARQPRQHQRPGHGHGDAERRGAERQCGDVCHRDRPGRCLGTEPDS